jgi:NAD-dependent dihydropyrimidine dehydrogenase PreA subunit
MYYLKGVTTLQMDTERCVSCRSCLEVCPRAVFAREGREVFIKDKDACIECGACAKNCPASALSVKAGVGCAAAIIIGAVTGTEPNCGGNCGSSGCC